jgi:hypothetical protein
MTNPVMVIRATSRYGEHIPSWRTAWLWCPGCDHACAIPVPAEDGTLPPEGAYWSWDGNREQPTFSPSILQHESGSIPRCHSYVQSGRWQFLSDCTHNLAGQTVDMVPLPDWLCQVPYDDRDEEVNWDD